MTALNHSSRKHARLSPSGAQRWLACTPSASLEDGEPDRSTVYSREGTLAHELADLNLQALLSGKSPTPEQLERIESSDLYSPDMPGYVQVYTDYVWEQYQAAITRNGAAQLFAERRVDLSHFVPGSFGTNDATILSDGTMEVVDLKYGKGVSVSAEDNPQLKLYALGAYHEHALLWDIHTVQLTIVQPRKDSISTWELPVSELLSWAQDTLMPRAQMAHKGEGELNPGDHCRWCRVKHKCPALTKENLALAKMEFAEPRLLPDSDVLEAYKQIDRLQMWAKAVSEYVLEKALAGHEWPGYKIVEGRSNRRWSDPEEAIAILRKKRIKKADIVEEKIKGITKIEKLLGRAKFREWMAPVVEKPQGRPTLVPASDKRPEFNSAKADFDAN